MKILKMNGVIEMKLIIICGPHAVGKMTVGQELAALTGFKLMHNHTTIEFVNQFFDVFGSNEGKKLNSLIKQELLTTISNSDLPGFIYTCMVAFDVESSVKSMENVVEMFKARGADIYVVELFADFEVRLERNKTENRLLNKPSKRDIIKSENIFRQIESEHTLNSDDGELNYENYLRIDNTNLLPDEAAKYICEKFALKIF